VTKYPQLAITN